MKPLTLGIALLGLASGGCLTMQPVGPFANQIAGSRPKPTPGTTVTAARDAVPPALPPAPPPAPPALMVTPGEVTEANHKQSARRLVDEMEADRKAMDAMPRYAEVSVIKGR